MRIWRAEEVILREQKGKFGREMGGFGAKEG